MAKLTCIKHHRNVITGDKKFIHRNGDGSSCDSKIAMIGKTVVRSVNARTEFTQAERNEIFETGDLKSQKLLREIFEAESDE